MFLAKIRFSELFVNIFLVAFFVFTITTNIKVDYANQYLVLAQSFLNGKLYFPEGYYDVDLVLFNSKYYWHQGPFPAVVLMPFVYLFNLFNLTFQQGYLQFFITLGIFILCYKIARYFKYSKENSKYLAFAFCFASIYQLAAFFPVSWFFGQAITVFLLFTAIYIYLASKNYFLIGVTFSLILLTRISAVLGLIFFVIDIIFTNNFLKNKLKYLFSLFLPIGIAGLILLIYNYVRFGNFLETGYLIYNQTLPPGNPFFSIRYFLGNLYAYFFKGLDVSFLKDRFILLGGLKLKIPYFKAAESGTSFFIVSPIFLYLFSVNLKEKLVRLSLFTTMIILIYLLCFYYSGGVQIGPRYLLDLLPFAFLLLLQSFKKKEIPNFAKILIILSALFNLHLFIVRVLWSSGLLV
ncbi:hypothetical protein A2955_00135 [Candidatus Woesebacteria bacterium RIFCSPLOWO2_01_FULL_37_19]|uniref:Glycosyltransferase RgtA/B/C/D-like domain-containing protein n=1 Tax=Candidatus Woesebacteria bacterium RIFCSPLOWO2_01_FULL_37_19 TaxID=1802514 RepID=A0A1F8B1P5_9BACT|nr:MAG: hypothetical protein A2955_00135 [Candidatus Woesebacteria bacterium RIFCSPLOWO2_01_FULL_37_19]